MPEGFHLGVLSVEEAEQVTREMLLGDSKADLLFFRYLLQAGNPSATVFMTDHRLVANAIQRIHLWSLCLSVSACASQ